MYKRNTVIKNVLKILAIVFILVLTSYSTLPQQDTPDSTPSGSVSTPESPAVTPSPSLVPSPSEAPTPSETVSKVPAAWRDSGIFSDYYEKAYELVEKMTLEEKIGQMMLIRCPQVMAAEVIQKYQPGGLVLFEIDFKGKTMDGVIGMIQSYQNAARIPMIIATDEEGGSVVRISRNPNLSDQIFRSPQKIYNSGGFEAIRSDTLDKGSLLKKLGLNLNLAPVADVSTNPGDYINPRAFGQPAAATGDYVVTVVSAMQEKHVSSALKHFPGYGNNSDTHQGIAVDNRPLSSFAESDFIPFEMGIKAGVESILVSHNIVNAIEEGVPASLSKAVHRILRNHLNFTGIIMTDDLSMGAIKDYTGNTDPAVMAVLAGNDMLLLDGYESAFNAILAAVTSGEISEADIDHAVFRVLSLKLARGMVS